MERPLGPEGGGGRRRREQHVDVRPDPRRRDHQLVTAADRLVQAAWSQVHHHLDPGAVHLVELFEVLALEIEVERGGVERRQQPPRDAGLRHLDRDVDELEARLVDERHRGVVRELLDLGIGARVAEGRRPGRALPAQAFGRLAGGDEILERDRRRR